MKTVISGMGVISAAGMNLPGTLETFKSGQRNGGPVSVFSSDLSHPVFEVKELPGKWHNQGMRTLNLALCAIEEALADAGLPPDLSDFRAGVCLGTTVASQLNDLDFYRTFRNTGDAPTEAADRFLRGNLGEAVARYFRAKGPSLTVVNACSSGADAIGAAFSWLKNGICDIAIAGGADEISRIPLCGFNSLGIISEELCRPFDRERTGLNLGEGAGILILEAEAFCRKRGREPGLYLSGYGTASDSYHLTAPHPKGRGLESALQQALAQADISPREVCFVNAHGTATPNNDEVEGRLLARVLGQDIRFLSTKGFTGHTLGAAGGLEAAFTAAALSKEWIPASPGFASMDDNIPICPVTEITPVSGRFAVSTSLAFGGTNTAIVIGM
ncbi:beta-ketoacyl-[acyl-carrier-protein] synthase family protein [Desulfococcaceae bacterium HSG8]|nr:beta-ketoacyl-[acyl-carrier-protein] synthase family protein [Desulfococcaceae bacterium HSG8]